jgi:predicted amidophosphoribosyltransferase
MEFVRHLALALADAVFPPRDAERIVRSLAETDVLALAEPALVERTTPAATALARYRTPAMRALVAEAKYRGSARAQDLLGTMLAAYLADWRAEEAALEDASVRIVLVPLPLSRGRRRERGFNQCEEIARRALARLPAGAYSLDATLLARPKETERQTALTRLLRRRNMERAFAATRPADAGVLYIVADDVITTGATLGAAVEALKAAGAARILPLALAH